MRYDPTSAQEPVAIQPGTYSFSVIEATESTSKQGNEMITLKLAVFPNEGDPFNCFDYLVNTPGGLWKMKMFCKEVKLDFDSGELTAGLCLNRHGLAVFDYSKKDVQEVARGERERAYLKVVRYGVHQDKPAEQVPAQPVASPAGPDGDGCPAMGDMPADSDIPF